MTTQGDIERDGDVAAAIPLLARATTRIGHLQIRNRGTVGGSLAHADPAAEYPANALGVKGVGEGGAIAAPGVDEVRGSPLGPTQILDLLAAAGR